MSSNSGTWSQATIGGHDAEVFEPPVPSEHGYVAIYLHGVHLAKLSGQPEFTKVLADHQLPVVAPMAGPSWWADRICPAFDPSITPERHVLDNVLPYIEERFGAAPPQIGLFGTSMGGQGALRLAYKHPDTFPVVAGISPVIDYHLRLAEGDEILFDMYEDVERARQDTAILHIHPLNWPRHQFFCCDPADYRWYDSAERLRMKLYSLGVPHVCDLETSAGGHGFAYYNFMAPKAIGFLVDGLDQERRRIR